MRRTLEALGSAFGRSWPRLVVAVGAALTVAACSGGNVVGNGVKPDRIVVSLTVFQSESSPGVIYQCEIGKLRALMVFSDGSYGDFTNRVTWSSSSTSVAKVSNADLPVDEGNVEKGYYAYGTLVPQASTGPATITADYQGLTGYFNLTVLTPDDGSVQIVSGSPYADNYLAKPEVQAQSGTFWLGTGTTYPLKVLASLGGIVTDISSFATWSFDNGGDPGVVKVSSTGLLAAVSAGASQTLRVSLAGCPTNPTLPVAVADIKSLSLTPQTTDPLIVGNAERLTVAADMGLDLQGRQIPLQDVSGVVSYWVGDNSVLGVVTSSGVTATATSLASGGPVSVQATGNFGSQAQIQSPIIQISTQSGVLQSLTVSQPDYVADPAGAVTNPDGTTSAFVPGCAYSSGGVALLVSASACYAPFKATGTFLLTSGKPLVQDVTRNITWSVSDDSVAAIGTGAVYGGRVTSSTAVVSPTTLTVTATATVNTVTITGTNKVQLR